MQQHLVKGKEVLKILKSNGFDAYFVGEAVRNSIMSLPFKRVKIVTNASQTIMKGIFHAFEVVALSSDSSELIYDDFAFEVQTLILIADNNQVVAGKHYSKSLLDYLSMQDYTINALAMNSKGTITDVYNGCEDIKKKRIVCTNDSKEKFLKNGRFLLSAFTIVSELNFKIARSTAKTISKYRKCLDSLELEIIYDELDKMCSNEYTKVALGEMIKTNVYKSIPSLKKGIRMIYERFKKITVDDLLMVSFILNKEIDYRYQSCIKDNINFNRIYNIAMANPKCKFDKLTLFSAGADVCLTAAKVNYLSGKCPYRYKKVKKQYEALPIKKVCDLAYKGEDILKIIRTTDTSFLQGLIDEIILEVLNKRLNNTQEHIRKYVIERLKELNIPYSLTENNDLSIFGNNDLGTVDNSMMNNSMMNNSKMNNSKIFENKDEIITNNNISQEKIREVVNSLEDNVSNNDGTVNRIDILERRLNEQEKLLLEKEKMLKELAKQTNMQVVDDLVLQYINILVTNPKYKSLQNGINISEFSRDLSKYIVDYVTEFKGSEE